MATVSQETFVSNFLQLLSAKSEGVTYDNHYKEDLSKVSVAPVSFPKRVPKKTLFASGTESKAEVTFKLKFKSIKPPYKFTVDLQSPASNTVYQVKEQLIDTLKKQDDKLAGLQTSQLKLLVKSKVPQDSTQLKDIQEAKDNEISFMVMVGKSPVSATPTPEVATPEPEIDITQLPKTVSLSKSNWTSIHSLLVRELGEEGAELATKRLKKGWDLAK